MDSVLVVSHQSKQALLAEDPEEFPGDLRRIPASRFVNEVADDPGVEVIVIDAYEFKTEPSEVLEELVGPQLAAPQMGLIDPDHPRGLRWLINAGLKVFVHSPMDPAVFAEARQALQQGRRFVDPVLSDSLVEFYLNRESAGSGE